MKNLTALVVFALLVIPFNAQIDVGGMVKNKVNQRVEQKTNQAIDKTLDKTEEGVKEAAKGDKKKSKSKEAGNEAGPGAGEEQNSNTNSGTEAKRTGTSAPAGLKTYSKFDFVPGEKILVEDNFASVAIGDFPADWNTNGSGEIVTVEGAEGKWLMIGKEGVFIPDYITDLPENFTMQFDLQCNEGFNYYTDWTTFTFLPTANRQKLNDFGRFSHPANAVRIGIHPTAAGGGTGRTSFQTYDNGGSELMNNEVFTSEFNNSSKTNIKVSIWRQKQRLRVYINEEKVFDVPRAFDASAKYNTFILGTPEGSQKGDRILISNIRLAVGAPDTRSKLITEGKFVTHGILFDSGSDRIKPESYGALKDIAAVLTENPTVKVKIIGHTDSDGDESTNLDLSKKRAAAVKESLSKEFAIDASRMETDGKGESAPADKNDTPVGKANNRRVEFVKL
jgi:outer membrane protein OmpA-like peptidoglycan-associated protein